MKRYCLAVDLVDDEKKIADYELHHQNVWPEIRASIRDAGIEKMEIYRTGTRLFMIMETADHFNFEQKKAADKTNKKVQQWEALMWNYQQALPGSVPGEKWVLMKNIFSFGN